MRKNIKLIVGIFIGLIIGGSLVMVIADTIFANQVLYDNTNRVGLSNNVQGALDDLYVMAQNVGNPRCPQGYRYEEVIAKEEVDNNDACSNEYAYESLAGNNVFTCNRTIQHKYKCVNNTLSNTFTSNGITYTLKSPTEIPEGAYISYTSETTESVTVPSSYTGWTPNSDYPNTITPSELNIWRVIKKASDNNGYLDIISHYTSSTAVSFYGQTGYTNLVYGLNMITNDYYTNSLYVRKCDSNDDATVCRKKKSHYFGYSNQQEQCYATNSSSDTGYNTEYDKVVSIYGNAKAYKVNDTSSAQNYWLASRYVNGSYCYGRVVNTSGSASGYNDGSIYLYDYYGSTGNGARGASFLRPIVTLDSSLVYYCPETSSVSTPCIIANTVSE